MLNSNSNSNNNSNSSKDMKVEVLLNNSVIDIFGYYSYQLIKKYPQIIEFDIHDLDRSKRNNTYYCNHRSIILV